MKVNAPPGSPSAVSGRSANRAAAAGFSPEGPSEASAATPTASASAASAVSSLEALLALQAADTPLERRRRAVRRAGRILDALDDLRLAALDPEGLDGAALAALQGAIREARSQTEDSRLENVLEEVEIRAAVEMAKREHRPAA